MVVRMCGAIPLLPYVCVFMM